MNACSREADVLRAAREDRWPDGLREHVAACEECAAAMSVAPWMTRFARLDDREHRLPDPSILWLKSTLLATSREAARISRPITIAQLVAYVVVAGGWASLLTWKWTAVNTWLHGFNAASIVNVPASMSMPLMVMVMGLLAVTATLALHTILADET